MAGGAIRVIRWVVDSVSSSARSAGCCSAVPARGLCPSGGLKSGESDSGALLLHPGWALSLPPTAPRRDRAADARIHGLPRAAWRPGVAAAAARYRWLQAWLLPPCPLSTGFLLASLRRLPGWLCVAAAIAQQRAPTSMLWHRSRPTPCSRRSRAARPGWEPLLGSGADRPVTASIPCPRSLSLSAWKWR